MANTQLGGAETIDSYRKKIMTILKKSGRTPVSDRDLATKCRTNRGGAANFRRAAHSALPVPKKKGLRTCLSPASSYRVP